MRPFCPGGTLCRAGWEGDWTGVGESNKRTIVVLGDINSGNAVFNRASVCPVVIVIVVVVGMDVVSNTKRVVSDSKCPAIDSNRRRAVYADTIAAISSIQILFNRTGVCPVIVAVMVIVGVQVNSVVRSVCDSKCPAAESNKRTIVVLGDIP